MNNDDVGAIIARAAELKQRSEDQLTPQQLREVGAELGIEARFVDAAVRDLERRRSAKNNRNYLVAGAFVVVVLGLCVLAFGAIMMWPHPTETTTHTTTTTSSTSVTINNSMTQSQSQSQSSSSGQTQSQSQSQSSSTSVTITQ